MKITVTANDFCPNDCPYCDVNKFEAIYGSEQKAIFECKHWAICKHVHELKTKKR